jgi:hypothetical protein
MSWRIDDHPAGGLQITHLVSPRFTARWTTGAFPIEAVREGAFFWTDEGSGGEDAIHLYDFTWEEQPPLSAVVDQLMKAAAMAVERHIIDD